MAHSAVHDAAGHGVVDPRDVVARPPVRTRAVVWRFLVMALLLGLVCGGIYWFNGFRDQKITEFFAGMKPPPAPVVMAEAKAEPVPVFLSGIGTLAAVHQVTVAPEIG